LIPLLKAQSVKLEKKEIIMHFIASTFVFMTALIGSISAKPFPQGESPSSTNAESVILWNGQTDVVTSIGGLSTLNSASGVSPALERRIVPGDKIDCDGTLFCNTLGGPTGQCAAASRLIDAGNTYSTTGE
jgi:hypothetical protein